MKMHRIVVYVLDFEGYGAGEHTAVISNAVDHVVIRDEDTETAEIGTWTDDHPINLGADPGAYFLPPEETEEQRAIRQNCIDHGLPS